MPPQRKKDYYFCYECLRLICERLFGVIDCYSQYSKEIPPKEFENDNDLEMVVTKVTIDPDSIVSDCFPDSKLISVLLLFSSALHHDKNCF